MYLLVRVQARFRGLISRKKVKTSFPRKQLMEFKARNSQAVKTKKIVKIKIIYYKINFINKKNQNLINLIKNPYKLNKLSN